MEKQKAKRKQRDPAEIQGEVAKYLYDKIEYGPLTQVDIARSIGYTSNIVSMMKWGEFKLPINKCEITARALDANPRELMELMLEDYLPDTWEEIRKVLGAFSKSDSESALIKAMQKVSKNGKRKFKTDKDSLKAFADFIESEMLT